MARSGDSIRYGFAVGRVMVLRTRLLGRGVYERMLDAPTLAEQKRVLSETHFGRYVEGVETASDVERAVDESLADLYVDFLAKSDLPRAVVDYFRVPHDFTMLKGALKARVLGGVPERPDMYLGNLDAGAFESPESLPDPFGEIARRVLGGEEPLASEQVDAIVDSAMFLEMERLARASHVGLLEELVRAEADVANAKVLLRCAIARRDSATARAMLVPAGRWHARGATALVARPQELAEAVLLARVLPTTHAADLLDLTKLDVLADAAVARLAREAAHAPVGPEPVLGYVLARRAEAASVRAVLVGHLSGVPRDVVASRLREVAS